MGRCPGASSWEGGCREGATVTRGRPRDRFGRPLARGSADEMLFDREPEEVVSSLEEAFDVAVDLFDRQRFFEAHEFFEHIWKADDVDPADRDFWKGVTQVAVGCVHSQRGNARGAVTLLERAVGHLDRYPAHHLGVDRARLSQLARDVAAAVRTDGPSPDIPFPAFPRARDA